MNTPVDSLSPAIKDAFQKFIAGKASANHEGTYVPTPQDIQQFVEYAAKTGLIQNTPAAQLDLTKALVRANMITLSYLADGIGWHLAAQCLYHSCQDYPSAVIYYDGSWQSNEVKSCPAYQTILASVKQTLRNDSSSYYYNSSSATMNSPTDMFLALNKVNYEVSASKNNGTWSITVHVYDTYDFNPTNWTYSPGITGDMANILNSYGVYAESIGAVVPYTIDIYGSQSYTP